MSRIRVLHLLTSLSAGGAETNLLSLLRDFDTEHFEHAVAFGGTSGALKSEFRKTGSMLLQISGSPLGVRSLFNIRKMVDAIREYSPDVIHSHLDLPNLLGLAAKKRLGCKLVIHLHGLGLVPHEKLPDRRFIHRVWNLISRAYRHSDKVIAICKFQLPFLEKLGIGRDQITLIPNGISLDASELCPSTAHDGYVFVNIGRLFPQKNHEMLLKSFHSVVQRLPVARLRLIGDGPLRRELEQEVRRLDLQHSVEFMGVRRDIPSQLASSDCFVQSSRWELHPITILEAMRAGLPVIATDVGGVADTVVNGETGLLVESGDENGLTQAMLSMALDERRGKKMGEKGAAVIRKRFDSRLVARQIEAVYRAAMNG